MPHLTHGNKSRRQFLQTVSAMGAGGVLLSVAKNVSVAQIRQPFSDVLVLIPGIMGSVLSKDNRDVWALSGSAMLGALKTIGGSVKDLTLRNDPPDRDDLGDGIVADRIFPDMHLIPGLWKVDGYSTIAKAITDTFDVRPGQNYFEFAYDWRRDNRVAARRLGRLADGWLKSWRQKSGNRNAKLILVAHSMGGLVSRYFLEVLGGWRSTRTLITFGTPYRGSLNALNFLANGLKKSIGPFTLVDISTLVRSFTSVYQLLPIYPCYDPGTGPLLRVAEVTGIPNVNARRAQAALDFHNEIRRANEKNAQDSEYMAVRYAIHPIIGRYQPTLQIGRRTGSVIEMLERHPQVNIQGDGTVPEVSATPIEPDALTKQHRNVYVAEVHGSLQNSGPMLDHLKGIVSEGAVRKDVFREITKKVALAVEDAFATNEPVRLRIGCEDALAQLMAVVTDTVTNRQAAQSGPIVAGDGLQTIALGPLPEGTYRVRVFGGPDVGSASDVFMVIRP